MFKQKEVVVGGGARVSGGLEGRGGPEREVQVGRRGDEGQGFRGSGVRPGTLDWISLPSGFPQPISPAHPHTHTQTHTFCFFLNLYSLEVNSMALGPNCLGSALSLTCYGLCDPGRVA